LARLRVRRDDRDEQHALLDLLADFLIPLVAVLEAAVGVEPDLDAPRPQRLANAPRGFRVLRRVAEEHRLARGFGHEGSVKLKTRRRPRRDTYLASAARLAGECIVQDRSAAVAAARPSSSDASSDIPHGDRPLFISLSRPFRLLSPPS